MVEPVAGTPEAEVDGIAEAVGRTVAEVGVEVVVVEVGVEEH